MTLEGVASRTGMLLMVVVFFAAMTWMITWGEIQANYDSVNAGLQKLEDEVIKIQAKIDEIINKPNIRKTKRVSTISDLDAKLCTILDILAKVVVPVGETV